MNGCSPPRPDRAKAGQLRGGVEFGEALASTNENSLWIYTCSGVELRNVSIGRSTEPNPQPGQFERIADTPSEAQSFVESLGELPCVRILDLVAHPDDHVDVLGDELCLRLRVASVEHHAADLSAE